MQWVVWIRLSNGAWSRYWVYDSREEADAAARVVGGVVELV